MKNFLGVIRAPFLLLTPVCMSLGVVTAYLSHGIVNWPNLIFAVTAGLCAHISVNALNEYIDFKNGLDYNTIKTPFSGGSGTLVKQPEFALATLYVGLVSLLITVVCGLYLIITAGWGLLPFGIAGVFIIAAYTPWINRYAFLCLIAPGLAFGPIMVIGTHYALTGEYSLMNTWVSLVPFFLVSNLLLLNQFPDVEADRDAGRRHLPIRIGRRASGLVFGAFLCMVYLAMILAVWMGVFPASALLGLITMPVALFIFIRVRSVPDSIEQLVPSMGLNVLIVLATPLLLSTGLYLSA